MRTRLLAVAIATLAVLPLALAADPGLAELHPLLAQPHIAAIRDPALRERVLRQNDVLETQERQRMAITQGLGYCSPSDTSVFQDLARKKPLDFTHPLCFTPPPTDPFSIDPRKSLLVFDTATLSAADFSLKHTLDQLAAQVSTAVPGTTAVGIYRQFWDTQNTAATAVTKGPHCFDNGNTLNGFPVDCRGVGSEAFGTDAEILARFGRYTATALVNRLDLAQEGWRNCGEHRIVYSYLLSSSFDRRFIIFEGVLPNPKPGCREGCLPVMQFWQSLSAVSDPAARAARLHDFYYNGLPGFRPVVHVDHYGALGAASAYGGAGGGQIRTNVFDVDPWILKEFRAVIDCGSGTCRFDIVPAPVKGSPYGALWNEDVANTPGPYQARAQAFQASVLLQMGSLGAGRLVDITYAVDPAHEGGQSISTHTPIGGGSPHFFGEIDDYLRQFNAAAGPTRSFRTALASGPLTAEQVVNRATTQSCGGCHTLELGLQLNDSIGGPVTLPNGSTTTRWTSPLTFTHIGFNEIVSPGLTSVFLPARRQFLVDQLNAKRCGCQQRFGFLGPDARARALALQSEVMKSFEPRFDALSLQLNSFKAQAGNEGTWLALQRAAQALVAESDARLRTELRKAGIALPIDDATLAAPRRLNLKAGVRALGDAALEQTLRAQEIGELLRQEPPRRTATGSFAVH